MMQACGPKTREDVGMTVTDPMVKSLQNANKAAAIEAITMLEKMHEAAHRATDVSRNFITKLVGDMTPELMKLVLDMGSDYQSTDDVADVFAAAFANPNATRIQTNAYRLHSPPGTGINEDAKTGSERRAGHAR